MEALFLASFAGVAYSYFGYPATLWLLARLAPRPVVAGGGALPTISLIVPVYNEAATIHHKVANTAALDYPADRLQILFVSDGSTDATTSVLREARLPNSLVIELPSRQGKAAALNAGLARATHEILVFTDASIELERDALTEIVRPFADPTIGCVSGEDRIAGSGGEAAYGRYELGVRRLESRVHSIAGASGSFYAQRRELCQPFAEGLAPDFLSVLRTVEQGFRAVSAPAATGHMRSTKDPRQEFRRKVRTILRGMTALFAYGRLLNPLRSGRFAFILGGHKVLRWMVPFFLLGMLVASVWLAPSPLFLGLAAAQAAFYGCALLALRGWGLDRTLVGRIALFFSAANLATLVAWFQYSRGVRTELWSPTQR